MSIVHTCSHFGLQCDLISVECDISRGLPHFSIVGLGDTTVQESKERIRAGIKNSGFIFPVARKTVNLAPAKLRKHGSHFDLPIALSLLLASNQLATSKLQDSIVIGELSLNGEIKGVTGVALITQFAIKNSFKKIYLPLDNAAEAALYTGIEIIPLENLRQFTDHLTGKRNIPSKSALSAKDFAVQFVQKENAFDQVYGLEKEKRAIAVSIAGGHNILINGSPGYGKTVIARSIKSVLPPMSRDEILENTQIYSVAGLLPPNSPLMLERPFREIHSNISVTGLIGGGAIPRPGEISLANNGILFLDEIAEFKRSVIENLRQPMEDKFITIQRSNYSVQFPCKFSLIATMNPCPCGFKDSKRKKCVCTAVQIRNYMKKLSGPILDRFDIFINVKESSVKGIFKDNNSKISSEIRSQILEATSIQVHRFKNTPSVSQNGEMKLSQIKDFCRLNTECERFLNKALGQMKFSNRAHLKILKTARTIADMNGSGQINLAHLAESIQYRINE